MAPPSVSAESKKQRERNHGRKRRQKLRQQSQAQQLQEADSHETVRLVSQVHHAEADVANHHLPVHEHSRRGHPVTSSASIQHLPPETSDFRDSSIGYNTSLRVPPPRLRYRPLRSRILRQIQDERAVGFAPTLI
ncbi:hypothetical protein EDB80DRAFT_740757 [Ilyonectria destructans]|nr:hypothetical protein EDB80DRAFT_740757 [Ilyonectria destructans]